MNRVYRITPCKPDGSEMPFYFLAECPPGTGIPEGHFDVSMGWFTWCPGDVKAWVHKILYWMSTEWKLRVHSFTCRQQRETS